MRDWLVLGFALLPIAAPVIGVVAYANHVWIIAGLCAGYTVGCLVPPWSWASLLGEIARHGVHNDR